MKLTMTGLDHKRADVGIREKFAVSKEKAVDILALMMNEGAAAGCVIISTCNRTELYASIPDDSCTFALSEKLCVALGVDFSEYGSCLIERTGDSAIKHLFLVASGLDSQILGDDQIITQVREALELSRRQKCADSFLETLFRLSIQAAKAIKTNVFSNFLSSSSVPSKTVEKLQTISSLAGKNALVIGSGKIGRLVAELLIRENMNVAITRRTHKKDNFKAPYRAHTVSYDIRYKIMENADIVISATKSPHTTITFDAVSRLKQAPKIIVDLAVPRDVEPSIKNLNNITLLTIDDITGGENLLPPERFSMVENIINEHMAKYYKWLSYNRKQRPFFPMFVDMNGKDVLVVGGGNIAERRIKILMDFGAKIKVIAPVVTEYIERAHLSQEIHLLNRRYQKGDIKAVSPFLVLTAADDRQVNEDVTLEAKGLNILVSVADNRDDCSFYFPAIAKNENYTAALVSNNGNHGGVKEKAQKIRELIDL